MNGFEKHGIDHLSASSINLFTNAPDVWVARYLLKQKMPFGPAPERGKSVEEAVVNALLGVDLNECIDNAISLFDQKFFIGDEATTKERNLIAPMCEIAFEELKQYGKPEFPENCGQERIEINARTDKWSIPVIGFLDLVFPEHGLVVDLKTSTRVPSKMSADHQVQRAIYARAKGNYAVKFLYVSDKRANWLEDGDPSEVMPLIKRQIERIEAFLSNHDTASAQECVPTNPHSFYWRGAEAQRQEIYGL